MGVYCGVGGSEHRTGVALFKWASGVPEAIAALLGTMVFTNEGFY